MKSNLFACARLRFRLKTAPIDGREIADLGTIITGSDSVKSIAGALAGGSAIQVLPRDLPSFYVTLRSHEAFRLIHSQRSLSSLPHNRFL